MRVILTNIYLLHPRKKEVLKEEKLERINLLEELFFILACAVNSSFCKEQMCQEKHY